MLFRSNHLPPHLRYSFRPSSSPLRSEPVYDSQPAASQHGSRSRRSSRHRTKSSASSSRHSKPSSRGESWNFDPASKVGEGSGSELRAWDDEQERRPRTPRPYLDYPTYYPSPPLPLKTTPLEGASKRRAHHIEIPYPPVSTKYWDSP